MARELRAFAIMIPAATPISAGFSADMSMPARIVEEIHVRIPPGPAGEMGFAIGSSGVPVLPTQAGQFIVTDDEVIRWPLEGYHDSGSWTLFGYNTGQFPHTVYVRFLLNLPQRSPGPLSPGQSGGPVAIPGETGPAPGPGPGVPPPPAPPAPVQPPPPAPAPPPPPGAPPPPAIPPPPVPSPPTPPAPPAPPGSAPTQPAAPVAKPVWSAFMKYVTWNGQQQLFRVQPNGTLIQAVNAMNGTWAQFELGVGYVPGALETQVLSGVQLHVWALKPDGGAAHFWQDAGTSTWNVEQIPNA